MSSIKQSQELSDADFQAKFSLLPQVLKLMRSICNGADSQTIQTKVLSYLKQCIKSKLKNYVIIIIIMYTRHAPPNAAVKFASHYQCILSGLNPLSHESRFHSGH